MAPVTRASGNRVSFGPTAGQSIPKKILVELSADHDKACMFCGQKVICEQLYGRLYQIYDIVVHQFCLLFSRAVQNGGQKDGILGFLLFDIKTELTRSSKEICVYCMEKGASVSCYGVNCQKNFHLPCGMRNKSMHQYFKSFKSFCQQHHISKTLDIPDLQHFGSVKCTICKGDVRPAPLPNSILAPCCKSNVWFHRKCVQNLAFREDYFFKCPSCNNVEQFTQRMLTLGIYLPSSYQVKSKHRMASDVTVHKNFEELTEWPITCNAVKCLTPFKNQYEYQKESNKSWEMLPCQICGLNMTHRLCSFIKCFQGWSCSVCQAVKDRVLQNPVAPKVQN